MSKTSLTALAIGTLTLLAWGSTAVAKGGGHGGPFGAMSRVIEQLELSPEQMELGSAMRDQAKTDQAALRTIRSVAFDTIQAEMALEQPDSALLHSVIDEQLASMSVTMHDRLDDLLTLHATFSAEQRATLVQEMDQAQQRKQTRMEAGEEGAHGKRGGQGSR